MPIPSASELSLTWRVSPDLLGILNSDGYFERSNPAWQEILGWTVEDLRSVQFFDFLHPDDLERTKEAFAVMKKGQPILRFENRYRDRDGNYHWLSWVAVPEEGKFLCSAREITEDKERQIALEAARKDAELREQFIAVLGHDLRNPLAGIASASRLLRRLPQADQAQQILDMMDGSVARMSLLIDDVLDLARARLGDGIGLSLVAADNLGDVIAQVVSELSSGAEPGKIDTHIDIACPVRCDPPRLAQLASNLIGNALTHGVSEAPIVVRATVEGDRLEFSVTNRGTPIPVDAQARLFQPFFRNEVRNSRQGLGLGLYIASQIAQAHGGDLSVSSSTERTVFTFVMPLGPTTSS